MSSEEKPLAEVFMVWVQWYNKNLLEKQGNMAEQKGVFYHRFDDEWELVCNGHDEPLIEPVWNQELQPFHARIYRNGWLYLLMNPYEGTGIAGAEQAWIDFIKGLEK